MAESIEEFLARGGKIDAVPAGESKYKDISALRRAVKRKYNEDKYTDFQMRQAENETHCKKPGNI